MSNSGPLSQVPLAGSLPLSSMGGLRSVEIPDRRLGGLPGLGDTSGLTGGLSSLGSLTHGLPVGA
ncbi:hypothetical protein GXW82_28270 [Streptacidiphilus sp. 4-A2]|nr:hypothetical protein [Streptacidiphilus sp. 4-A2]